MPNTSISFPASPTVNQQYTYGTTTYVWTGTEWMTYINSANLMPTNPAAMNRQMFSGTGSQTVFTLASDPGALGNGTVIYINGVYQQKNTYTTSGTTLTFTEAPPAGTNNIEVVNFVLTNVTTTNSDFVNYVPAGAGAVARTGTQKFAEYVSVKDFGAVGDGVTDDTVAIQAAINATTGILWFPTGTYRVNTRVLITHSNISLVGDGIDATKIHHYYEQIKRFDATANDGLSTGPGGVPAPPYEQSMSLFGFKNSAGDAVAMNNISFADMTLEYKGTWHLNDPSSSHGGGALSGIHAFNVNNLTVTRVKIKKFNNSGIKNVWFDNPALTNISTNIIIKDCIITQNHFANIHLYFSEQVVIESTELSEAGPNLNRVSDGSMTSGEYYPLRGLTGYGFATTALSSIYVQNVRFDNCSILTSNRNGIDMHSGYGLIVTNCKILNNITHGVDCSLNPTGRCIISNNIIGGLNGNWNKQSLTGQSPVLSYGGMSAIELGRDTSSAQVANDLTLYTISNNHFVDIAHTTPGQGDTINLIKINTGQSPTQTNIADNIFRIGEVAHVVSYESNATGITYTGTSCVFTGNNLYCSGTVYRPFYFEETESIIFANNYLSLSSGQTTNAVTGIDTEAYLGVVHIGDADNAGFRSAICSNNVLLGTGWDGSAYVDYSSDIARRGTTYQYKFISVSNTINGDCRNEYRGSMTEGRLVQPFVSVSTPAEAFVVGGSNLKNEKYFREWFLHNTAVNGSVNLLSFNVPNAHTFFTVEVEVMSASASSTQGISRIQKRVFAVARLYGNTTLISTMSSVGEYSGSNTVTTGSSARDAAVPNPALAVTTAAPADTETLTLSATFGYTTSGGGSGNTSANVYVKITGVVGTT